MAIQEYSLTTIKNGIAALPFEPQEGEYTGSQGIDPDLAIDILGTGNLSKYSGLIYPTLIYFLNSSIICGHVSFAIKSLGSPVPGVLKNLLTICIPRLIALST